jgi:biotin transport system substrate-specific component
MLRTIQITRTDNQALRLVGIAAFVVLMAIGARITIPFYPVPFTMQVLVVLLSGLVLGSRDAFAAQAAYVGMIAVGVPIGAAGMGTAVFTTGASWGYLIGFIFAAFVVGWLAEHGAHKIWQRWLAGFIGILIIYAFGVPVLAVTRGMDMLTALNVGAGAFLLVDLVKAFLAALMVEGSRSLLLRNSALVDEKAKN